MNTLIYNQDILVEPQHIDSFGHVNNVVYLQWMEQIAWAHSQLLGLGLTEYQQLDAAMVAREHHLHYKAAAYLNNQLSLQTWLSKNDGLHLYREYQFIRHSDQKTLFTAQTHWVCVSLSSGKAKRMPEEFKKAYIIYK